MNQTPKTGDLALIFLRLGLTAFGGPAAHIAMMRQEFVERHQWLTESDFLDIVGASSLLPGPSSTEAALFIGLRLRGSVGLLLAGLCFISPAVLLVTLLAWAYVRFGHLPSAVALLYGIKPAIVAIVAQAVWALGKTAIKTIPAAATACASLIGAAVGWPSIVLFFLSGSVLGAVTLHQNRNKNELLPDRTVIASIGTIFVLPLVMMLVKSTLFKHLHLISLFVIFAKIGSMVCGSGYVLLAILRNELITKLHWITTTNLLDAVAVGQFTPGPVFTTATFIGYLLLGPAGALVATAGIFIPAFLFVGIGGFLIKRIRQSNITSAFIDGVNAAAVSVMAVVTVQLALAAIVDLSTAAISAVTLFVLIKFKPNSAWLVLGAGGVGLLFHRH